MGDSWMRKFKQTWPDLFELLSSTPNKDSKIMWKDEFERRLDVGKAVRDEVSNMSPKCFFKAEPSLADFQVFEDLVSHKEPGNSYTNLYVLNELIDMVHVVNEGKNFSDLTTKYYAEKCLEYVRHQILKEKLNILLKEEQSNDTSHEWDFRFYETILVVIAQWCQPIANITSKCVSDKIESLAASALSHLLEYSPEHSIFDHIAQNEKLTVRTAKLPRLKHPLTSNLWNPQECRQLITSVNFIMFTVEDFICGENVENSFINVVIESKIKVCSGVVLSILYGSVLARLGVYCQLVCSSGQYSLRWSDYTNGCAESAQFIYIDACEKGLQHCGRRFNRRSWIGATIPEILTPLEVARGILHSSYRKHRMRHRMMERYRYFKLVVYPLELLLILEFEEDVPLLVTELSLIYIQLEINYEKNIKMLQNIKDVYGVSERVGHLLRLCHSQINLRSREVQIEPRVAHFPFCRIIYNIGQVCYIKSLGKNCVITGWKRNCALNECLDISDGLSVKSSHIFYRVLGDNGYVGDEVQENLIPISPVLIINDEVGKFFESFVPRLGYIPNVECAKWFPEKHSEPS